MVNTIHTRKVIYVGRFGASQRAYIEEGRPLGSWAPRGLSISRTKEPKLSVYEGYCSKAGV